MKKCFSCKGKFNIFLLIGAIFIIVGFFYTEYPVSLIGLLITCIPETKNEINNYKETGKINFYLIMQTVVFLTTIYIIISSMLGI
ncbi:MAG: hypothetical protein RRZ84_08990 [Romboutsia sp.]